MFNFVMEFEITQKYVQLHVIYMHNIFMRKRSKLIKQGG